MSKLTFGMVDVFAAAPLQGNPLAVVEVGEDLADDAMRAIAREFNQAETTFIMASVRADWKLRSFTAAGAEVFGAGHNALGAWLWLAQSGVLGPLDQATTFQQEIGGTVLPITLERRGALVHARMRQAPLTLLPVVGNVRLLASALGLASDDIRTDPAPRAASAGVAHLMVRARDQTAVDRAEPVVPELLRVLQSAQAEGCYLYAFDTETASAAYARFFNPTVGLFEDAATGTAAGPLAAYLSRAGLLSGDSLLVEQGVRLGRRSFLAIKLGGAPEASGSGTGPELSGSGVVVMEGQLSI